MEEERDNFEEPIEESTTTPSADAPLGIAWGFVAFLLGAALLAIFVVQNTDETRIQFLFWDITMSAGVIIMLVVLLTLTFDQLISFLYRRSKRKKRVGKKRVGKTGEV
jgi:uncharacterized integral membrane protein